MSYREKPLSDRSVTGTDDEDKNNEQDDVQDIHRHDDFTEESTASYFQIEDEPTISKLEQELVNGLDRLKILDVNVLSEKSQRTHERMKEETERDTQILAQLKHMTLLDEEITNLKSTQRIEGSSNVMGLSRLEHELVNGLEMLKILDENVFSEKIQRTKERIKHSGEKETEKDMQILAQLKDMTLLDEKITNLKCTRSVESSSNVTRPRPLEQETGKWVDKSQALLGE